MREAKRAPKKPRNRCQACICISQKKKKRKRSVFCLISSSLSSGGNKLQTPETCRRQTQLTERYLIKRLKSAAFKEEADTSSKFTTFIYISSEEEDVLDRLSL